tara:strand:- start:4113 stop:4664 length:552 start_codon:yes stop_codon:yes gene_type:complete
MKIYNLTSFSAVIDTDSEIYALPPHQFRFELPHPKPHKIDIGYTNPIRLFGHMGECPSFLWNDIVIVTPEQFASFKFPCEVWIASGLNNQRYHNMCRVQLPVDPATIKKELDFDEANAIVVGVLNDTINSYNLTEQELKHVRNKIRGDFDNKLVRRTLELANDTTKLKQLIRTALNDLGYNIH